MVSWLLVAPLLFAAIGVYFVLDHETAWAVGSFVLVAVGVRQAVRFGPAAVRAARGSEPDERR